MSKAYLTATQHHHIEQARNVPQPAHDESQESSHPSTANNNHPPTSVMAQSAKNLIAERPDM